MKEVIKMEKHRQLTGIIKKAGNYYVALCLELNVSSQGESIEEAKRMLQEACEEYLAYIKEEKLEDEIRAVPLEILREFLVKDVEYRAIKNSDFKSFGTSQN
jgi:predicted RNase H-like HicB family nuclease